MPRPNIDFARYVKRIPEHTRPLVAESTAPILHHERSSNDAWNLLLYADRNLQGASTYPGPFRRHMQNLRVMVLLSLVEAFERFLKELAAVCIDEAGPLVLDKRLNVFTVKGGAVASHLNATHSIGKALVEAAASWSDCGDANDRFRDILASPFNQGTFYVFPKDNQNPPALRGRFDTMEIVWQLRHSVVHNCGVITASDAQKFRLLCKNVAIAGPANLDPSRGDVWYVKLFLDDTARLINHEVHRRLSDLLAEIASQWNPLPFDAGAVAQRLADAFRLATTICGNLSNPSA